MSNEVRIKLTDEQKAKIKEATGKDMGEIRVGNLGENPAFSRKAGARARLGSDQSRAQRHPGSQRRPSPQPQGGQACLGSQDC